MIQCQVRRGIHSISLAFLAGGVFCCSSLTTFADDQKTLSIIEKTIRNDDLAGLIEVYGPCIRPFEYLKFEELNEELPFLHFAVSVSAIEIVTWCLENDANRFLQDSLGRFPGEVAIIYGEDEMVRILSEAKASFSDKNLFCFFSRRGGLAIAELGAIKLQNPEVKNGFFRKISWEKISDNEAKILEKQYEDGILSGIVSGNLIIVDGYFRFDVVDVGMK